MNAKKIILVVIVVFLGFWMLTRAERYWPTPRRVVGT